MTDVNLLGMHIRRRSTEGAAAGQRRCPSVPMSPNCTRDVTDRARDVPDRITDRISHASPGRAALQFVKS